jgi:hypothetical protein
MRATEILKNEHRVIGWVAGAESSKPQRTCRPNRATRPCRWGFEDSAPATQPSGDSAPATQPSEDSAPATQPSGPRANVA